MRAQLAASLPYARIVILISFAVLAIICCHAEAPETVGQALKRYGVEINEAALVQALSDSRKEVRGLAAAELADMKLAQALPEIVRAAETEQDGLTQVNIAAAATWLGSDEALSLLKGICETQTKPGYVRVAAARNVLRLPDHTQDHNCFLSLVDMIDSGTDTEGRVEGLDVLAQVSPKADFEEREVLRVALKALQDPEIILRLQACEAIKWIGDPQAIAPLQEAMRHEQEKVVSDRMAAVLKVLRADARQSMQ